MLEGLSSASCLCSPPLGLPLRPRHQSSLRAPDECPRPTFTTRLQKRSESFDVMNDGCPHAEAPVGPVARARCHHVLSSVRESIDNPFPVDTVHGAFVATANAHPDRIAVLGNDDDGTPNLSFRQLVNLCRSLARHLTRTSSSTHARCGPAIFRAGDPSPGIAVGASAAVSLDSSIELIVAYFAVLMAGKAYRPSGDNPPARGPTRGALRASRTREPHAPHRVRDGRNEPDHPIRPGTRTLAIRLLISKSKSISDAEPGWRYANAAFRSP